MSMYCFGRFEGFDCSIVWMLMIFLFFIIAIFRRQVAENLLSTDFNVLGATVIGELAFVILALVTASYKWALLAGLVGMLIGGFLGAQFFGGGEGGYEQ